MLDLYFKLCHPEAQLPEANHDSAGFDIRSTENTAVPPGGTVMVGTGICLASYPNPNGYFLKIEGRSGMASRGVFPTGGIVDPDYRGEIKVILHNSSTVTHDVKVGERVAQIVPYRIPTRVNIHMKGEVSSTDRGADGFGSTGK